MLFFFLFSVSFSSSQSPSSLHLITSLTQTNPSTNQPPFSISKPTTTIKTHQQGHQIQQNPH
ncbi:hypothetical protein ACJW31_01G053400 [Castanea mollissima]